MAALANLLDRDIVIETVEALLDVKTIDKGDGVIFDDIATRLGDDSRIKSARHTIDGSESPR